MKKSRKKRPQGEEIVRTIINKMFEIAGHNVTYDDIKDRKDNWYQQWTMTEEQNGNRIPTPSKTQIAFHESPKKRKSFPYCPRLQPGYQYFEGIQSLTSCFKLFRFLFGDRNTL